MSMDYGHLTRVLGRPALGPAVLRSSGMVVTAHAITWHRYLKRRIEFSGRAGTLQRGQCGCDPCMIWSLTTYCCGCSPRISWHCGSNCCSFCCDALLVGRFLRRRSRSLVEGTNSWRAYQSHIVNCPSLLVQSAAPRFPNNEQTYLVFKNDLHNRIRIFPVPVLDDRTFRALSFEIPIESRAHWLRLQVATVTRLPLPYVPVIVLVLVFHCFLYAQRGIVVVACVLFSK